MEQLYLSADLYESAFLISHGAAFKRVEQYFRNGRGKAFSIMSLEGVTLEMLKLLDSPKATVNYHKFKENRKKLKDKAEKYAEKHEYGEASSEQIKKLRRELYKQRKKYQEQSSPSGPKRVMPNEELIEYEQEKSNGVRTNNVSIIQPNTVGT